MEYQHGAHSVYDIKYHMVWVTKYRYQILNGEVALRARELIRQTCMSRDMTIDPREYRERPRAYLGIVSNNDVTIEVSTVCQREIIEADTRRVSPSTKTILGTAYVGKRVFLFDSGECH